MNYPINQFNILTESLKQLSVLIDLKTINPNALHFIVYQQFSEGQKHNQLYCVEGGTLKRYYQLTEQEKETAQKLLKFENDVEFLLYPDKCNDNHVETAVKKALKDLNLN